MPCRSDYLEATGIEKGLKEAAELALFAVNKMNEQRRGSIFSLPQDIFEQAANYYAKDAGQVQFLCNFIRNEMTEADREAIVYDAHDATSRQLATWWETHCEADRAREAEEAARAAALAKLTPADRRALGL